MAKSPRKGHKVVLDVAVLDDATKKRVMQCIERRGKITVTLQHKGAKALGNGNGGFEQKID